MTEEQQSGALESGSLAGKRVLLIDDTEDARRLMRFVLQLADAEVVESATAVNILELAQQEKPDIIIMDVHMPEVDGLAATRLLRADAATRAIPIIVVSASAMLHEREKAQQAGCDGFIAKPIDALNFAHEVAGFLRFDG